MLAPDAATAAQIARARTVAGVPHTRPVTPWASIDALLMQRAAATPERDLITFIDDDDRRSSQSYATFADRVARAATLLAGHGIGRGDRVATLAYNHPDTLLVYFACWRLGATVAPQNAGEDDARIRFILDNAGARLLVAMPGYAGRAAALCAALSHDCPLLLLDDAFHARLAATPPVAPAVAPTLDDECLLVYTSGTTGAPKGVQLSHYNLLADAHAIADWQQIDDTQRMMTILPVHHVNGIVVTTVTPVYAGAGIVLNRSFRASRFWQRIVDERVTIASVVPTILQFLCEAPQRPDRARLALRHIICGAGTLAVALAERFETQFDVPILHGYGLSETTCYSCFLPLDLTPAEHRAWLGAHGYPSIGVPIATNEMAIHDPSGVELPAGQRGEIVIRGHNVMLGYFQRPDANAEAFRHGWFRSGDEGFMQRDGRGRPFFFITGRLKELINRGGVKYSPFEIEEVLGRIPGVRVGLAVAFDNVYYGEEVGAYVVAEDGATLDGAAVLAACRAAMPFSKCPKVVVFGTEIPVTSTGKYQRLRLKAHFAAWEHVQFRE